jgi:bifunctional DNase/RNase
MTEVTIRGISMTEAGFLVLLQSAAQERTLPIAIGSGEAQAILFELKGMEFPRPLTHDLFRNVLSELGATLTKVEITELREETFFALLHLDGPAGPITVDARPSDALALALRCGAVIQVDDAVMERAGVVIDDAGLTLDQDTPAAPRTAAPPADQTGMLKAKLETKLEKAIAAERYEEAARLRDMLREL